LNPPLIVTKKVTIKGVQNVLLFLNSGFPNHIKFALARVYSCLQNGDVLLFLSCRNWYDNNEFFIKQIGQSLNFFSRKLLDSVTCVPVPIMSSNAIFNWPIQIWFKKPYITLPITFYRVCHGFRPTNWDDYFWVNFDHFWIKRNFLRHLGQEC